MIVIKVWYKTCNQIIFIIIKVFMTGSYYLKKWKYKTIVFTIVKNIYHFIIKYW